MVTMEASKCRKLRRIKGSYKKKSKFVDSISDTLPNKCEIAGTSKSSATPPRICKSITVVERGKEEVRGVEWQYHGKYVETDVPIVWGSPQGSPTVNKARVISESPLRKLRKKSSSPRILNKEYNETPQFLNDILALSEKIKAEEKNGEELSSSSKNEEEGSVVEKNVLDESISNYFDEDMNECMIQCSQELEQLEVQKQTVPCEEVDCFIQQNIKSETIVPTTVPNTTRSSPRIKTSSHSSKTSLNTSSGVLHLKNCAPETTRHSPRIGSKNYVQCKRKVNTYVFQGRVLGSHDNSQKSNSPTSGSIPFKSSTVPSSVCSLNYKNETNVLKCDKTSKSSEPRVSLDNSFETIKESFLDDDLDILSILPDDVDIVSNTNVGSTETILQTQSECKGADLNQSANDSSVFEDSLYFEDTVLQFLDSIESNVTPSPPLRCTPEEIEKKRQEAKMKLQKKNILLKK